MVHSPPDVLLNPLFGESQQSTIPNDERKLGAVAVQPVGGTAKLLGRLFDVEQAVPDCCRSRACGRESRIEARFQRFDLRDELRKSLYGSGACDSFEDLDDLLMGGQVEVFSGLAVCPKSYYTGGAASSGHAPAVSDDYANTASQGGCRHVSPEEIWCFDRR